MKDQGLTCSEISEILDTTNTMNLPIEKLSKEMPAEMILKQVREANRILDINKAFGKAK